MDFMVVLFTCTNLVTCKNCKPDSEILGHKKKDYQLKQTQQGTQ